MLAGILRFEWRYHTRRLTFAASAIALSGMSLLMVSSGYGPAGVDVSAWPFAKTVGDELYFAPESGRLFASPMDEGPVEPCDAQPDEYDVALAAHRVEQRTTMRVGRIHSRWAGLRTFAPDRHLIAGFDPRADGFFWLAGQGGFGLQTSPAMAGIVESLIAGSPWPIDAVTAEDLSPARFLG
jgi:D-arginine dehydrogenase